MAQMSDLNKKFASEYTSLLKNRDVDHRRVILTFSGVPGSGKTTLARRLAMDLRAQYVQHDQIRQMITAEGYEPMDFSIQTISHLIIDEIMNNDRNKFVILDASIDRAWPTFFRHVAEWGISPIVIRLNVSHTIIKQRLQERDGVNNVHSERLDTFMAQFENCKAQVTADFELATDYSYSQLVQRVTSMTA
jgi:predicted kinase